MLSRTDISIPLNRRQQFYDNYLLKEAEYLQNGGDKTSLKYVGGFLAGTGAFSLGSLPLSVIKPEMRTTLQEHQQQNSEWWSRQQPERTLQERHLQRERFEQQRPNDEQRAAMFIDWKRQQPKKAETFSPPHNQSGLQSLPVPPHIASYSVPLTHHTPYYYGSSWPVYPLSQMSYSVPPSAMQHYYNPVSVYSPHTMWNGMYLGHASVRYF